MTLPPFIKEYVPLAPFTTFGVGGAARWFASISSIDELAEVFAFCKQGNIPWMVLGKGSNCLFDDRGYEGIVLLNKLNQMRELGEGRFFAESGYSFARLGANTARNGWSGLEFASGIPGSVGGAVYMNAGANGSDTSRVLQAVDFLFEDGVRKTFLRDELHFGYRHSPFQQMKGAVTGAVFALSPSPEARDRQHEMLAYRTSTQPYGSKSAGCVFRNPEGYSAGGLIDRCGLKGMRIGGAEVSPQHANFIVNAGGATAEDILNLMKHIRQTVLDKYGIELRSEVCYIDPFPQER